MIEKADKNSSKDLAVKAAAKVKELISGNGKKKLLIPGKGSLAENIQELPVFLTGGQNAGLISNKEMPNALSILTHPGDSPLHLAMRSVLSKNTPGKRKALAIALQMKRDKEHGNTLGLEFTQYFLALSVSDNGLGREQTTSAIIGQREHEERQGGGGGGIGKWLQNKAWGGGNHKDGG